MDKITYNDDTYYKGNDDWSLIYDDDFVTFYSTPPLVSYNYDNYYQDFDSAKKDPNFVWYPCQGNIDKEEFKSIKEQISKLKQKIDAMEDREIFRQGCYLKTKILLNDHQRYTYEDYLKNCAILKETGRNTGMVYNPPLKKSEFLQAKKSLLTSMAAKDIYACGNLHQVEGYDKIFPY